MYLVLHFGQYTLFFFTIAIHKTQFQALKMQKIHKLWPSLKDAQSVLKTIEI